ncbi:hypothetical protein HDV05_008772 [Chytridiales sp. JEL 0842]|nr:hypothetical protein HDV05_008772 [Chytridiales sp. JEL 0842]
MSHLDFLHLHPFVKESAHDKAIGVIVGSALGDAIGLYTEFMPSSQCHKVYPAARFTLTGPSPTPHHSDSHRNKFHLADWTDDTDQSLILVLSYLSSTKTTITQVLNPLDVAIRIKTWCQQGLRCLDRLAMDVGSTTSRVVSDVGYERDPVSAATKVWIASNKQAAPNGSLMRTAPVGVMCVEKSIDETFGTAAEIGRITHVDPRCVVSCCLVSALVRGLVRGEINNEGDLDAMIDAAYLWVNSNYTVESLDFEEYHRHCHTKSLKELYLDDTMTMGYVYKCLGSSLLLLRLAMRQGTYSETRTIDLFESLINQLVMEGGDADTNACVAGALLGAWLGYSRLPPHWERGIRNREWLLGKANALSRRAGIAPSCSVRGGDLDMMVDPDTALDGGKGFLTGEQIARKEKEYLAAIRLHKEEAKRKLLAK